MTGLRTVSAGLFLSAALSACAHHPRAVAIDPAPVPVPVAVTVPELPVGVSPTMVIPAALADGSYPTPNRGLTAAATVWHFRAALNVAALACRGTQGDEIVANYNAMLTRRRSMLAATETRYAAEWRGGGGDWHDRYDDAMTRLYNYFSLSPARASFCAAATQVLADATTVPDDALPGFAAAELPALDRPFTDVYRAFDAWRAARRPVPAYAPPQTVIAFAAAPRAVIALAAAPRTAPPGVRPRLELDPSVFQER